MGKVQHNIFMICDLIFKMSFTGTLALITGAGSGIGRAVCQKLAKEGAIILAADKNLPNATDTVNSLEKHPQHLAIPLSVESSESVTETLEVILKTYSKPPSVIVNAAAIIRDNFITKLSEDDFQEVIDVNLKGTFLIVKTFANSLAAHGIRDGSIINFGSVATKLANMGQSHYCASKAGVDVMTKIAAKEYGKAGIRFNAILPGFIKTPMTAAVPEKIFNKFLDAIPMGRAGRPEEIAEVVAFLASSKSSYINGASIEVNGGI